MGSLLSSPEVLDVDYLYSQPPPSFGKKVKKHFSMDPEYANLNNGSYGTTPRPVLQAAVRYLHRAEKNPDHFHRIFYQPLLIEARTQVAKLVNAHPDEIVFVSNATTAVNTVLRNFDWSKDDVIIGFSTSYAAISSTINYLSDVPPFPKKSTMPLLFPTTHEEILKNFRAHLRAPENQPGSPNGKRVCVIDSIASNPGTLLPWKEMVKICKEEGVWSVIDAAHSLGQEVGIDLTEAAPDFWFANAHKWLSSKRSTAALYIPFRNQHVIKTSLPTGNFYIPLDDRNGDPNIHIQFEWFGTIDWTNFITVTDAIKFRNWLGGEEKINEYTHNLALEGGKLLAEMWGTELLDPEGKYTLSMVNVELPIPTDIQYPPEAGQFINKKLLEEHKTYSAFFFHNGKWWTRCSVQIYNDISDFKQLGKAWLALAKDLKDEYGGAAKANSDTKTNGEPVGEGDAAAATATVTA